MAGSGAWKMFLWACQDFEFEKYDIENTPNATMKFRCFLDYYFGSDLMNMFLWTMGSFQLFGKQHVI